MLAGFGVPDLRGGQGTFSFYSTDLVETAAAGPGGGQVVQVKFQSDTIQTAVIGPRNRTKNPPVDTKAPLQITVHKSNPHATLSLQGQTFDIPVGGWSDWKKVNFEMNPWTKANGMVRFYLQSVEPQFNLYVSPINFDPRKPAFAISHPSHYAKELAEHIGLYHTLGQAEDTWSLNEGRVSEETFLEQAYQVIQEREAMLLHELNRFDKGLLVTAFDTPDRIQHMFWRFQDPSHPLYDAALAKKYEDVLPKVYQTMDRILGQVLKFVDDKTVLMVVSDHGFSEFHTAVHMNRWLAGAGYLQFKGEAKPGESNEFFTGVDWSKTRAYAVGLAGIYLNLEGRERNGIVKTSEASKLSDEIIQKLSELADPATGKKVVKKVYPKDEIYEGPYVDQAADLVVGFEEGYRFSWQTALGAAPSTVFEPNAKRWSGDHCVDPPYVSGVFLSNRPINTDQPRIIDIAATILKLFGIEAPPSMDGRSLL
jgi:predicted AlkP superfamily phosphohydrolase/phosphomutase